MSNLLSGLTFQEWRAIQVMLMALGAFGIIVGFTSIVFKLQGKPIRPLWIRYLAFFPMLPIVIVPLVLSVPFYIAVIAMLSLAGFYEFSRATGLLGDLTFSGAAVAAIIFMYVPVFVDWYGLFEAMPAYTTILILLVPILGDRFKNSTMKIALSFVGVIYFGWFLAHLAYLRHLNAGIDYVVFFLTLVIANDAFAYLIGNFIGRHQLRPSLSPNKTTEGALGAWLATIVLGIGLAKFLTPAFTPLHAAVLATMMSIGGLCGDLVISAVKRDMRIKDMGRSIPGHGGILDRLDSIIFTAPIFFHYVRYFLDASRVSL